MAVWAKQMVNNLQGKVPYKEDYPNGNEEEGHQEGCQKEKEVADLREA